MQLRVISPRLRFWIYLLIELLTLPMLGLFLYAGISPEDSTPEVISWIFVFSLQLFVALSPLLIEKFDFGAARFLLDASGVTYLSRKATYHLDWTQVQLIALNPNQYGRFTKNCFICFYTEEIPRWMPMRADYTPTAFGLQYRKGLPQVIAQYCSLPIENLERIQKGKS
ncbi:MAG: hypothetical protein PHW41_01025 [Eubacteriales bacterium]|nr:hypothetical protein [Eubacteriales bacterium]